MKKQTKNKKDVIPMALFQIMLSKHKEMESLRRKLTVYLDENYKMKPTCSHYSSSIGDRKPYPSDEAWESFVSDSLWDDELDALQFDKEFNKKATHTLSFIPWAPVESESFVFLSSASGSLEVFDKSSFQCVARMIIPAHFRHQPINIGSDCVCCIVKEGVYKVDLRDQTHVLLSNRSVDASLGAIEHNGIIYASDNTGICTKYRITNGGIDMIDIQKPCAQPIYFENRIILVSKEDVYEIGA